MSAAVNDTSPAVKIRPHRGWIERLIIVVMLLFVVAIRLTGQMTDPPKPLNDPALRNLLTLIFSFIALVTAWIWISFRSHYPLLMRRLVFIGPFAAIAIGIGAFRFVEFSGSMVPHFAPRWHAGRPEKSLGKLESNTDKAPIDLASTSPNDFPQFLGPERSCWIVGPELA